ncbi:hypothetical protein E2562_021066 [Oryza meyeriana var. granulata]|uniref:Peroxidase n=1 Tax=Oryza meyeriana var. granulata TaxID=110450 RepID=A0A6G1FAT1_9ORYZ|nr:hypothetical protein E2562_021066 [Oryza meyeriana var. granulata]
MRRPLLLAVAVVLVAHAHAQLSPGFYSTSCPTVHGVVRQAMSQAVMNDTSAGPAVLRLFYHDCFVGGCDASVLLDDTPTAPGEKGVGPNAVGSTAVFGLVDSIKTQVEAACPATVSCADILALAARDSVNLVSHPSLSLSTFVRTFDVFDAMTRSVCARVQLGGPSWAVPLGRRDALAANRSAVSTDLPGPEADFGALVAAFAAKGLSSRDLAALSGAHTIGRASCGSFRTRVYCDANVSPAFASHQRQSCPASGGDGALAPLDSLTPDEFDNGYYRNLVAGAGLLHSDQELFNNGPVDSVVQLYSANAAAFSSDFAASMIKLGSISPLTGSSGEVRLNCRKMNS